MPMNIGESKMPRTARRWLVIPVLFNLRGVALLFSIAFGIAWPSGFIRGASDTIGYHVVKVDSGGRIVPWYGNTPSEAYDHVVRLVWNFWRNMRTCANDVPYYLQHQVWKPGEDDTRGLGGDQLLSSWNLLYEYLGDPAIKSNMVLIADYWLDHGMSKPASLWANLPIHTTRKYTRGSTTGICVPGRIFFSRTKQAALEPSWWLSTRSPVITSI
ncbi:MAG: hypothetical protein ACR2JB_09750 [Bryobacteraceae bacterium]